MSRASESRRQRRALKAAGVAVMHRVSIERGALDAYMANSSGDPLDLVAFQISEALTVLDGQGADVLGGRTVISIGAHPDYPGALTIEAKADTLKPTVDPDPGCPIDHSLDAMDEAEIEQEARDRTFE